MIAFLISRRKTIEEFIRFGLVGSAGLVVDIAVLRAYIAVVGDLFFTGDDLYWGQALAWLIAATSTWWLNRQFTFRHALREPPFTQLLRFLAVNAVGGIANFLIYAGLIATIGFCRAYPAVAVMAGTLVGMCFNFAGSRKLVFKPAS